MIAFQRAYGRGPLHLAGTLATFVVAAYALSQVFDLLSRPYGFVLWFAGAIVAHDLILYPSYSLAGQAVARAAVPPAARSRLRIAALNHLRVPLLLSGLLLLVWFPLVAGKSPTTFEHLSGRSNDIYFQRWLIATGVLFAASALVFGARARRLAERHNED